MSGAGIECVEHPQSGRSDPIQQSFTAAQPEMFGQIRQDEPALALVCPVPRPAHRRCGPPGLDARHSDKSDPARSAPDPECGCAGLGSCDEDERLALGLSLLPGRDGAQGFGRHAVAARATVAGHCDSPRARAGPYPRRPDGKPDRRSSCRPPASPCGADWLRSHCARSPCASVPVPPSKAAQGLMRGGGRFWTRGIIAPGEVAKTHNWAAVTVHQQSQYSTH